VPVLADRPELARHLEREFPCGHDDQGLRTFQRRIDPLQDRNRERGRLSGPRLRLCEEVTAALQGGYCADLYRRGGHETKLVDGFRDVRVDRELAEASGGWCEGQSVSGFRFIVSCLEAFVADDRLESQAIDPREHFVGVRFRPRSR